MYKPVVCVLALVCLSGIHAASIAGTFDEKPVAAVFPSFVAGDLAKPAIPEASVLPEFVASELTKPAPEAACESDNIQEEVIEVPELEVELPIVPEIVENPCSDAAEVEEEQPVAVVPEIEVVLPEVPEVRPLPEEEETAVAPEIEVILPEAEGACADEVAEAPVASILPAPLPVAVDPTQLISAQPIKLN